MTYRDSLLAILCYNTDRDTERVLNRIPAFPPVDILIVNDGSCDRTKEIVDRAGLEAIHHEHNKGVGGAIKSAIKYAIQNNYKILIIMAGNNKDDILQAERLLYPIIKEDYDYVQGSRFVVGGAYTNLPLFRYVMVKIHAFLFFLLTGFPATDGLNGFRAYKLSIFNDSRINIWQDWLDGYEFETYLHFKVLRLKYKVKEVAVSKIYPENCRKVKYSHIRPIIDWWNIMKPLFYLVLGLKK